MRKTIFIFVVSILIAGAGSFYGGMKYSSNKNQASNNQKNIFNASQMRQNRRQEGGGARMGGGGMVNGEIIKKDEQSITVKMRDNGSKIVFLSDSTSMTKSIDGSKDDLEIGKTVMVNGNANPDGSIVAQFVQIRPEIKIQNNNSSTTTPLKEE